MSKHIVRAASGLLLSASALPIMMMASPADRAAILEGQRDELLADIDAIMDSVPAEQDLTDEQFAEIKEKQQELVSLNGKIETLKALVPAGQGRKTAPEPKNGADPTPGGRRVPAAVRDTARHNFMNFGEFALGVRGQSGGNMESEPVKKLLAAATTYGNEGNGTDGGFLIPPEFSRQLWQKVEAEENLMNRCTPLTPSGNSMSIPKDETTPWGTGGVRVYWEAEAHAATASKVALELATMRLYKLFALVPASDELLEDAMGYESYLQALVPGRMAARINTAIIAGSGVGQPLGILNSPSVISVAKQASQPADTIWHSNISKMWSRMYAPYRRNAVWLINQDIEDQLERMAFQAAGASSDLPGQSPVPVYMPPGGVSSSPYSTLKSRPVVPLEACKALGDQGDIILADLTQYWILRKAAGMKTDTSMHLYFDQALTAFRFIFRINGQPMASSTIDRENGANTLSWAVTLDAR